MNTRNIMYISHGGGPMPLLGDPAHQDMVETLKVLTGKINKPSAILVISAHWEATQATITSGKAPELIYDYGGFPKESYEIQYPSPGEPELAQKIHQALTEAGISAQLDDQRGLDHGTFVPLKIMYPEADIPVVQLSLLHSLDADAHLKIGQALQAVQWNNLLVMGSGFSFHNMRAFFANSLHNVDEKNQAFEHWLRQTMGDPTLSESDRYQQLAQWEQAPAARFCHPREEHLLPLHVCYGLAGKASDEFYATTIIGLESSMFLWR